MICRRKYAFAGSIRVLWAIVMIFCLPLMAGAKDLPEIKSNGVLRHLGVPYANFVSGAGDGLDVELMQLFAHHIGVRYQYVRTDWPTLITDLTGIKYNLIQNEVKILGKAAVKGDVIANGLTQIDWRQQLIEFSTPTFPTQVWLVARADSPMQPINPSDDVQRDIAQVKQLLDRRVVLGVVGTCTDPNLYDLDAVGASSRLFKGTLNELAPAIINGLADATVLDVPDALVALEKWPGQIKVIGPVSPVQQMGLGFAKDATLLRAAFNDFFEMCKADGTYRQLVKKYYPSAFLYFPKFFDSF
ncbi:MAG: transporter substrate-binding domain-containing protein [Desulfobacteraceae bacterium]|jgi:ABC-type amino acid transport substrate-binding protein